MSIFFKLSDKVYISVFLLDSLTVSVTSCFDAKVILLITISSRESSLKVFEDAESYESFDIPDQRRVVNNNQNINN